MTRGHDEDFQEGIAGRVGALGGVLRFTRRFICRVRGRLSSPPYQGRDMRRFGIAIRSFLRFLLVDVVTQDNRFEDAGRFVNGSPWYKGSCGCFIVCALCCALSAWRTVSEACKYSTRFRCFRELPLVFDPGPGNPNVSPWNLALQRGRGR